MSEKRHGMSRQEIDAYRERHGKGPHVAADLAVVSVPWSMPQPRLHVLLVRRGRLPYEGALALPGGFVEMEEDLEVAARRELAEETGLGSLGGAHIEQLKAYGMPTRDPRGRVVTVVFMALVPWHELGHAAAGDDAADARFYALEGGTALDEAGRGVAMAFDHDLALRDVRLRLRELALHSSAPLLLLPAEFGVEQARAAYEVVLEERLDPERFDPWLYGQGWLELVEKPKGELDRRMARHRMRQLRVTWARHAASGVQSQR